MASGISRSIGLLPNNLAWRLDEISKLKAIIKTVFSYSPYPAIIVIAEVKNSISFF